MCVLSLGAGKSSNSQSTDRVYGNDFVFDPFEDFQIRRPHGIDVVDNPQSRLARAPLVVIHFWGNEYELPFLGTYDEKENAPASEGRVKEAETFRHFFATQFFARFLMDRSHQNPPTSHGALVGHGEEERPSIETDGRRPLQADMRPTDCGQRRRRPISLSFRLSVQVVRECVGERIGGGSNYNSFEAFKSLLLRVSCDNEAGNRHSQGRLERLILVAGISFILCFT